MLRLQEARSLSKTHGGNSDRIFDTVVIILNNKIRYFATMGQRHTIWRVPVTLTGLPAFDRVEMCTKIKSKLQAESYVVVQTDDTTLFVAW